MSILELKDVCYSYSAEKPVLRGMNCTFECGTLYALVGKSGAGKSTLLDAVCLALYGRTPRLERVNNSGNEIMTRRTAARCCLRAPPPATWTWTSTAAGRLR